MISLKPKKTSSRLVSDPAWEALKAGRASIPHRDAVLRVDFLQKQYYQFRGEHVTPSPVDFTELLRTLTLKKIPFVLTGTHGISGWMGRPRATLDIDILVKAGRNQSRAIAAIRELYPQLETRQFRGVTSFLIPGEKESLIDVTYPHRPDNYETLKDAIWIEDKVRGLRYRIPSLETALANKFVAMNTITRNMAKRHMDMADFNWMVIHSEDEGQQPIDLDRLAELGEMVIPGGGGAKILQLVAEAKGNLSSEE